MWGKKRENWYLYQHRSQFNMSCMLALSMEKIEGVIGTYSTSQQNDLSILSQICLKTGKKTV